MSGTLESERASLQMHVSVEFFGIVRSKAKVAKTVANGLTLGEICCELAERFPSLAQTCIDGARLRPGFVANVSGERFVTDPDTPLRDGDVILLLSMDAGG